MHLARTYTSSVRRTAATFISTTAYPLLARRIPRPPLSTRHPTMSATSAATSQLGVARLNFESTLTTHLPADPDRTNDTRPVQNACFSFVVPTPPAEDDVAEAWNAALAAGQVKSGERGEPVLQKALVAWSASCAALFNLPAGFPSGPELDNVIDVLGGFGPLWSGMVPHALCYGGHQFGNWAGQLGDGRAISLGEYVNHDGQRWEIQLKGAGKTPYSRFADGRAVLRSSVREFLCSEAMYFLGVPTTRALSLITTGAGVVRDMFYSGNPQMEPGAVVARVAPSFLRLGNFQLPSSRGDVELMRETANYAISKHFPHLMNLPTDKDEKTENKYAAFVREVAVRNAEMVAWWQAIGFVHGVMNTDNFSILGLTIDYGPYGFLDAFDPEYTPNTTDIPGGRYKFGTQRDVAHWNIMQFAKAMVPLCGMEPLQKIVSEFGEIFDKAQGDIMRKKLGLSEWKAEDKDLLKELEKIMEESKADMTNTWRALSKVSVLSSADDVSTWIKSLDVGDASKEKGWRGWVSKYQARLKSNGEGLSEEDRVTLMNQSNPVYILRNYMAQTAIEMAEKGDYSEVRRLYDLLSKPYEEQDGMSKYTNRPPEWAGQRGVCVNSCSS